MEEPRPSRRRIIESLLGFSFLRFFGTAYIDRTDGAAPSRQAAPFSFSSPEQMTPWLSFKMPNLRRILLPGRINNVPATIILDSGVGTFVLDKDFATRVGVKARGSFEEIGITGAAPELLASGVRLTLESLSLNIQHSAVVDLSDLSSAMFQPIDAILGRDAFNALVIDLDFANRHVRFRGPRTQSHMGNADEIRLAPAAFGMKALPISIEGHAVQALFDLGADRPLYLSPAYVDELSLMRGRKTSTALSVGVDGPSVSRLAIFNDVKIGQTLFQEVPTEVPAAWAHQVPAFVGFPVFRRFRLSVDFPNNRLLMAVDRAAVTQPFRKDRAGFGARRVGNHLQIVYIADGSPAQTAGLAVGDEIVAIDGRSLNDSYFANYTQNGSKPAGTHFQFVLASGAQKEIVLRDYY